MQDSQNYDCMRQSQYLWKLKTLEPVHPYPLPLPLLLFLYYALPLWVSWLKAPNLQEWLVLSVLTPDELKSGLDFFFIILSVKPWLGSSLRREYCYCFSHSHHQCGSTTCLFLNVFIPFLSPSVLQCLQQWRGWGGDWALWTWLRWISHQDRETSPWQNTLDKRGGNHMDNGLICSIYYCYYY